MSSSTRRDLQVFRDVQQTQWNVLREEEQRLDKEIHSISSARMTLLLKMKTLQMKLDDVNAILRNISEIDERSRILLLRSDATVPPPLPAAMVATQEDTDTDTATQAMSIPSSIPRLRLEPPRIDSEDDENENENDTVAVSCSPDILATTIAANVYETPPPSPSTTERRAKRHSPPPLIRPSARRVQLSNDYTMDPVIANESSFHLQFVRCPPSMFQALETWPRVLRSAKEAVIALDQVVQYTILLYKEFRTAKDNEFLAIAVQCAECKESSPTWALTRSAELYIRAGTEHLLPHHRKHIHAARKVHLQEHHVHNATCES